MAQDSPSANSVLIPVLQTFVVLLENDVLNRLCDSSVGLSGQEILHQLLDLVTKNVGRLKSVQRVEESMKTVVNMLAIPETRELVIPALASFLQHRYPRVRADTAEALYLVLQTKDVTYNEEAETILLETEWSKTDPSALVEPTKQLLLYLGEDETG